METIIHNFGAPSEVGRSAAEMLVGHSLAENQQLVIQIVNLDAPPAGESTAADLQQLPEWCNVYAGLSDEQNCDFGKGHLAAAGPDPRGEMTRWTRRFSIRT